MKLRPALIGVGLAALGVALQFLYVHRFEEQATGGAKVELLVAAQPIDRGQVVSAEMLGVRAVPQAYVDDRAIRAGDRDKILNLKTVSKVPVLQTLVWTDFVAATDEQRDLSTLVQPGNRAMSIRVQFEEAIQLVRPGDFVDILSVNPDGRETSVLLQRVSVLAAGLETAAHRASANKGHVSIGLLTVSVSLQEAQLLAVAQAAGELTVVVRNVADPRVLDSPPNVSRSDLYDSTLRQAAIRGSTRPVRLGAEEP
jgi:pilus assembly protein CpaB